MEADFQTGVIDHVCFTYELPTNEARGVRKLEKRKK